MKDDIGQEVNIGDLVAYNNYNSMKIGYISHISLKEIYGYFTCRVSSGDLNPTWKKEEEIILLKVIKENNPELFI